MKRWPIAVMVAGVAFACSGLPASGNGIVALVVETPDSLNLTVGDSLKLRAHAENLQGDSVAADILWSTPDTALITVDAFGTITDRLDTSATARVQASTGTLVSNIVSITLRDTTTTAGLRARP
ncbi:MAG TPA: hypothetical protein VGL65_09290 [Gemmatimonadales bacterium]